MGEEKLKSLTKGTKKFNKKILPTHDNLVLAVKKESKTKELSKEGEKEEIAATAVEIYEARLDEEDIVKEILTQWSNGGHGYIPEIKPGDIVRLTMENLNSLSVYAVGNWKVKNCVT